MQKLLNEIHLQRLNHCRFSLQCCLCAVKQQNSFTIHLVQQVLHIHRNQINGGIFKRFCFCIGKTSSDRILRPQYIPVSFLRDGTDKSGGIIGRVNFQEIKWEDLPTALKFFNNKKNVVSLNSLYSQANQIKIDFPLDKSVVEVKTQPAIESIMLEISGGKPPFLWFVNGQQIDFPRYRRKISWTPADVGFARITVMDSDNQSYTVEIWLKEHAL